eukprot:scaffold15691_cov97-Skeletonema_menzelii.AAC.1
MDKTSTLKNSNEDPFTLCPESGRRRRIMAMLLISLNQFNNRIRPWKTCSECVKKPLWKQ